MDEELRLVVIYKPDYGTAVPDGQVEELFQELLDRLKSHLRINAMWHEGFTLYTNSYATENIIYRIRLGIIQEEIPAYIHVYISYNNELYRMNEYAVIRPWPDGLCDYMAQITERILLAQMQRREKNLGQI